MGPDVIRILFDFIYDSLRNIQLIFEGHFTPRFLKTAGRLESIRAAPVFDSACNL